MSTPDILRSTLQQRFGFAGFRPGQREAIEALLQERRLLCIQPTGHGKSLLYQLPAVLLDGLTLVISPLLALMRDQLGQLASRFSIPAASVNSDQEAEANQRALRDAAAGRIRILFVAPEQLDSLATWEQLSALPVALLVVDEAHCISTWGHDFRPSYRQIAQAVRQFEERRPDLHILGLTATANARTEADIADQLRSPGGPPLTVLRSSMDRSNLQLELVPVSGLADKLAWLEQQLRPGAPGPAGHGSGILYCATRDHTELVAGYLQGRGLDVVAYHAGLEPEQKQALQHAFVTGQHRAIAATNALGMGIDKPDVRFVIHVDMPGSITAYYQEVGRAGRDGAPATGILLFDPEDRRIHEHFIRSAQPSRGEFDQVLALLTPQPGEEPRNAAALRSLSGLHPTKVTVILAELIEQGLVRKEMHARRQVYRRAGGAGLDLSRYERQHEVRSAELARMLDYGSGRTGCLMHTLRSALGDQESAPCGRCSACRDGRPAEQQPGTARDTGAAQSWLLARPVPIAATRRPPMAAGLAVLDGEYRTGHFAHFMRNRAADGDELAPELAALVVARARVLAGEQPLAAVVPLPSRTWRQRSHTASLVASALGIAVHDQLITWAELPAARQGQLRNNDQRRDNLAGKMRARADGALHRLPGLLLLDDYTGSGHTLREAARALRDDTGYRGQLVPLTIARVKWRIGAPGMV
jgi:ATP-dependent DNA helicase RecQ